jgi:hypothetical protein
MNDWIPTKELELTELCRKWMESLNSETIMAANKWNAEEVLITKGRIWGFLAARDAYVKTNTSALRVTKDITKKAAISAMREFANTSIRFNKNMNEAARIEMGIRPKDSTPTISQRPTSHPITVVENTVNHFEHTVKVINRETGKATRPADAYGIRYAWQVGGEPPRSGKDLPRSRFTRRTSLTITHGEEEKGKPAWYSTCYENTRGEAGPWSPVVESYIG